MRAVDIEQPDKIFHLGDAQGKEREMQTIAGVPVTIVKGNCDNDISLPRDLVEEVGSHRAFLTHGHDYGVGSNLYDLDRIIDAAKEKDCDMIFFGHTHIPILELGYKGMTIMNPGSLTSPRQKSGKYTYGILNIFENGEVESALKALK